MITTTELVTRRWAIQIFEQLNANNPMRYNELARNIAGINHRMLAQRLRELIAGGLVERTVYPEFPIRIEYTLTPNGRRIAPVFAALDTFLAEKQ
jgi:DNA-binding HxlR family transcriptional regulator